MNNELTNKTERVPQTREAYQAWVKQQCQHYKNIYSVGKKIWATAPDHLKHDEGLHLVLHNVARALNLHFRQGEPKDIIRSLRDGQQLKKKKPDQSNNRSEHRKAQALAAKRAPLFKKMVWTRVDRKTWVGRLP
ncbi:hypothetical protein BKI52_02565 [marine bacterium AO1-C]|nr:hypothetical protein BKI52_02565 [marine bacterium AO1-C]